MHKLLVADDSMTIQRVVELTFAGENIQVVSVGDGDQAIARIPVEHPDIVLADVAMPKRNGYEVSAFVKSRRELAHVPVLLLAGAFEPVDDTRARDVKSDGVIVKPFDPRQVVMRVRELLTTPRAEATTVLEPPADQRALEDYFDRLDHALQTRATPKADVPVPAVAQGSGRAAEAAAIPTIESVLDLPAEASAQAETRVGEPPAERLPITEDQIDDITNRVLERLSATPFRDVISAMVREVVRQTTHNSRLPTPNSQHD